MTSPTKRSSKHSSPTKLHKHNPADAKSPSKRRSAGGDTGRMLQQAGTLNKDLSAEIAQLSRHLSAPKESSVPDEGRRKKRTIGRAEAVYLHRSLSASMDYSLDDSFDPWKTHVADKDGDSAIPTPSTQLGYDLPETEAHREQMAKKLGTSFANDTLGKKLESLGTVKDSDGRASRRRAAR